MDLKIPRSLYLQMLHIDGWIEGKYDLFLVSNENRNETSVTETHVFQYCMVFLTCAQELKEL